MDDIQELIKKLRGSFSEREEAAAKLSDLGKDAVRPLIKLLKRSDSYISKSAENILVKIGEPAIEDLIDALSNDKSNDLNAADSFHRVNLQIRVSNTLSRIYPRTLKPLIIALEDENLVDGAIGVIRKMNDVSGVPHLIELWDKIDGKNNGNIKTSKKIVEALVKIDYGDSRVFFEAMARPEETLHPIALKGLESILEKCNSVEALDELQKQSEDCLGKMGQNRAVMKNAQNRISIFIQKIMEKKNMHFKNDILVFEKPAIPKKRPGRMYHSNRKKRS
jgi:hypothetical protein